MEASLLNPWPVLALAAFSIFGGPLLVFFQLNEHLDFVEAVHAPETIFDGENDEY